MNLVHHRGSRPLTLLLAPLLLGAVLLSTSACGESGPEVTPPGRDESTTTDLLETGSILLQTEGPPGGLDVHLVGFHPMKDDPAHQVEAHHFCRQVNEDFAQCALFDGDTREANLNGIEYIISEELFETLPEDERALWHPHNYEILSGQLVAPNLPGPAEEELMRKKVNSYGKTWHVWNTGSILRDGDVLPLGEPHLAWSFNRDGEVQPELVQRRDEQMGIDSRAKREERSDLVDLANPQTGVDALHGRFGRPTQEIPGVRDADAAGSDPD